MVIDASKGVEAQTIKLFKVCVMRQIPIFTFINKLDREAKDTFELLDDKCCKNVSTPKFVNAEPKNTGVNFPLVTNSISNSLLAPSNNSISSSNF